MDIILQEGSTSTDQARSSLKSELNRKIVTVFFPHCDLYPCDSLKSTIGLDFVHREFMECCLNTAEKMNHSELVL